MNPLCSNFLGFTVGVEGAWAWIFWGSTQDTVDDINPALPELMTLSYGNCGNSLLWVMPGLYHEQIARVEGCKCIPNYSQFILPKS